MENSDDEESHDDTLSVDEIPFEKTDLPFANDPTGATILFSLLDGLSEENEGPRLNAITKLLELVCDPKVQDEDGKTALHILADHGSDLCFNGLLIL